MGLSYWPQGLPQRRRRLQRAFFLLAVAPGALSQASCAPESGEAEVSPIAGAETPERPRSVAAVTPLPARVGLGRAASAAEIRALDLDVRPDGLGLPEGSGTAEEGRALYESRCALCHGVNGEGGVGSAVISDDSEVGFQRRVTGRFWPYSTTLYDYILRAMPWDAPGTLESDEVYALVAYLLAANEVIGPDEVMNSTTLPAVRMPALGRFVRDDRRGGPEVR